MRSHATLSASGSQRWISCPGSIRMSLGLPNTSSAAARKGTAAHELGEYCLREGLMAEDQLGMLITVEGEKFEVDQDMSDAVQVYLDFIRSIATPAALEQGKVKMKIEVELDLSDVHEGMFGTADCVIMDYADNRVYVIDYKNGSGVAVDPEHNSQMMYYALGATFGMDEAREVELVIVQPNLPGEEPVKSWATTIGELRTWRDTVLKPAALRTEDPQAPLFSGEHCKFCPAKGGCSAVMDKVQKEASLVFSKADLPAPTKLSPEQIGTLLANKKGIEDFLGSLHSYAQHQAEIGVKVPGMKLVKASSRRKWVDEGEAKLALNHILGEAAFEHRLKGIGKIEKECKSRNIDPLIAVEPLTEKPDRGFSLVPETDTRKEVDTTGPMGFIESADIFN